MAIGESQLNDFWICIVAPKWILKSLWLSLILQSASQKSATGIEHEAEETTLFQTNIQHTWHLEMTFSFQVDKLCP